jgi:F-type H+-transporting ATPase subunit b
MQVLAAGGEAPEGSAILFPAVYDLIWGGLSFVIVLVLFWKYVLPRMQKVMEERADRIEGGIARAEEMQEQARADMETYRQALAEAREEAAEIRTQAQADRRTIVDEARSEAAAAAAAVTQAAEAAIERDRTQVVSQLTAQVGALSVELASKIVGQSLTDDATVRRTVEDFVTELESMARSEGSR